MTLHQSKTPHVLLAAVVLACLIGIARDPAPARATTYVFPDSSSLTEAIQSALAPGDTLLVPPGRRHVSQILTAGIVVRGDGPVDSVIFSPYIPSAPILAFLPGPGSTRIENLTFDAHLVDGATCLYFAGNDVVVRGNHFYGGYGVKADSSKGLISENRFDAPESAVRCARCEFWVDRNQIDGAKNAAISMRGSPLRITRNQIVRSVNTGIVITGKRFVPVIGGEPGMGNEIYGGFNSDVFTDSGKPINAQYNFWGIRTTEEMNHLGYPANISAITDRWDQNKAAGEVDYRNWLDSPGGKPGKPAAGGAGGGRNAGLIGAVVGVVLVGALVLANALRRRGAKKSAGAA